MLSATSAFAETRHRDETDRRWDRSQSQTQQNRDRQSQRDQNRSFDNNRSFDTNRSSNNNRSFDSGRSYDNRSYGRGQNNGYRNESRRSESFQGRVSRVEHYNGGYRVWMGGTRYPFFIGADRWSRFPIRVGLSLRLGGYWNPAGYYDVYDVGQYATAGDIRGVVESVDYRRGTAVLRDDVSGSFVTIVLRGNDPRLGAMRPGDYVDLTGAWNRAGVFDAYNVADLRGGGYGRYDDNRQYGY
jgi:hypothetical protein